MHDELRSVRGRGFSQPIDTIQAAPLVAIRRGSSGYPEVAICVHGIVVIGGLAGGVEALVRLVRNLPADFPAAIFVVIHTMPTPDGRLPWVLSRRGNLPATEPRDGEAICAGHIYVAPPDHHLTIEDGTARVNQGPRENRHRPAIDPLF